MSGPFRYWEQVDRIKELKREGRDDEAIDLLLRCTYATKLDKQGPPAPWYFRHLAIIYRKQKRYADEIAVIDEYERALKSAISSGRTLGPPTTWRPMMQRREKARELLRKQQNI